MRGTWPPIFFFSIILHIGAAICFLLASGPHLRPAAVEPCRITLLVHQAPDPVPPVVAAVHSPSVTSSTTKGVAVASAYHALATAHTASAQSPAFVLKAHHDSKVRSPLDPINAPKVDPKGGIVFVLDISGSMYERLGTTTRLTMARDYLSQQIRALKNGTPFALAVYGETAKASGPLVPASDATRAAALHFIAQEYDCGGGTNLPGGFAAIRNLRMGAILLVTDGELNMTAAELLPKSGSILGPAGHSPALSIVGIAPRAGTDAGLLLNELVAQQGGSYQEEEGGKLTAALAPSRADATESRD